MSEMDLNEERENLIAEGLIVNKTDTENKPFCGIIRPISPVSPYSDHHWTDVEAILREAIKSAGYEPNLVSNSDEAAVIHNTIVKNLYDYPIVICDVSSLNPNVMFELGMRLTFDKPTIIIKDEITKYNFDTSPIEHIPYPSDLRYQDIVDFKKKLTSKIIKTVEKSKDPEYSTFLRMFGDFVVPKIHTKEVTFEKYMLSSMEKLRAEIRNLHAEKNGEHRESVDVDAFIDYSNNNNSSSEIKLAIKAVFDSLDPKELENPVEFEEKSTKDKFYTMHKFIPSELLEDYADLSFHDKLSLLGYFISKLKNPRIKKRKN